MTNGLLGWERKRRTVYEGAEWASSLNAAQISVREWDMVFDWVVEHASVQPLAGTFPFVDQAYRLIQIYIPNRMIGWVYFRIEPDDETCTLLWVEAQWFQRIG